MTVSGAKTINGFLILSSTLVIFILAAHLSKTEAINIENRVACLFLLFHPLIILWAATFGAFWIFFYVISLVWLTQRFMQLYSDPYLLYSIYSFILTGLVSFSVMKRLSTKIKSYRTKLINAQDRQTHLQLDLAETERITRALIEKFERFSRLKFIAEGLTTTLTLEEVTRFAVNRITELIPRAQRSLIFLVDERSQLYLASFKATGIPVYEPLEKLDLDFFDRWILRHNRPLMVTDVRKDFRFAPEEIEELKTDLRSLIASPLKSEHRIRGILRLDSLTPNSFNSDDLKILDIFSDLVAVAVENALLYRKMEELAKRDGLTNLYVPRYFHAQLETMISQNLLNPRPFSLLMLDIDHFKEYNDRYGHIAGDIVLKRIATILVSFLKEADFAVRYGGEEFLLVLREADLAKATEVANSIREEIASQIFSLRRKATRVTVSIGISTYPADGKTKEELLHKADEWLYCAKQKGRNRIAFRKTE